MRTFTALVLGAGLRSACAALPPGYEDEVFCPPGHCMMDKDMGPGYCGPRTAFLQCVKEDTLESGGPPKAWGFQLGEERKAELLQSGHHSTQCSEDIQKRFKTAQAEKDVATAQEEASSEPKKVQVMATS
ncbi:unnamed protein product [Amoebophrya sp. A25]|nr:unnamed protein product [Amoebophrya sp. A25]|eukprot:GSA25T00002529001.1